MLLYGTFFFGMILCCKFKHPNSRVCCSSPWIIKNHLYIGGNAYGREVFFWTNIVKTLYIQIQEFEWPPSWVVKNYLHIQKFVVVPPWVAKNNLYIRGNAVVRDLFFGMILCCKFKHPNSRVCCGPHWVYRS